MTQELKPAGKKPSWVILVLIAAVVVVVVLTASGFAYAASQETHDPFCGSCHTQPESTFLQQATSAPAVNLASYHTTQKTRCIDCHSGQGIVGRVLAEMMGARNAFKWYTGTAVQPAVRVFPIGDGNCLKCHQPVTQRGFTPREQITLAGVSAGRGGEEGRANHWHEQLARWQATSATAGTCINCHSGHITGSSAQNGFMAGQNVQGVCEACHQVLRRGEG